MIVAAQLHAVATTVQNLSLSWLIAAVLLEKWLPAGIDGAIGSMRAAAFLMLAAQPVLVWVGASVMADVSLMDAFGTIVAVIGSTHFGAVWSVGTILVVVLYATLWLARSRRHATWTSLLLVAFACSRTLISHAAGDADFDAAVLLDWTHLLLISAWVGEVAFAAFVIGPGFEARKGALTASSFAIALSRSATLCLGGVLVTGVVKSWLSVGAPHDLVDTAYGNILIVKLVFVAGAIGCGGFNRFVVMPSLARGPQDATRFFTVLKIESALLGCAMFAAAILGTAMPPAMHEG